MTQSEAGGLTRRVPRDAFEAALFRQALLRRIQDWRRVCVELSEDHADGAWSINIRRAVPPFGSNIFGEPYVSGTMWLVEDSRAADERRIRVQWRAGDVTNVDAPPDNVDWGTAVAPVRV